MVCLANHMDLFDNVAAGKTHLVDFSVLVDLNHQPFGERVDYRSPNAVKTAGYLIASAAELSPCMQYREDDFQCALSGLLLNVHGNTASVVRDTDDISRFYAHFDMGAVSGQSFVDGIIDNFIDQVVQTGGGSGADIHSGALAYGFQTFQNLDL